MADRVIDVGVFVDGEPEHLMATLRCLAAVRLHGARAIVLLADGMEHPECRAPIVRVHGGAAAALNALVAMSSSPLVALVENGARVCSGAIERLAHELHGAVAVAGPSTNLAWNEQQVADPPDPHASDRLIELYARARALDTRGPPRELTPPHSLGAFCYVARREVVLELGGADEAYDPGPCWEMDLSLRAQRAGYCTVWVPAAYVHRAPVSERRKTRDQLMLEDAKRRYQTHFPPREIREASPLLVTCIMPTRDRPRFVVEGVRNFLEQDYPAKELIIVDDGDIDLRPLIPDDDRITHVRLSTRLSIGEKRNIACARARGAVFAHFDDDDWYPRTRLSRQVAALSEGEAAVSGTSSLHYLDLAGGRAWRYDRPRSGWLAGNTLAYHRTYWHQDPFAPVSIGEDARFLAPAARSGGLVDLGDASLCVATLHPGNTSSKQPAAPHWQAEPPALVTRLLGRRMPGYLRAPAGGVPLVSCVMPTFDRPAFVALALRCFASQSYPNRELLIIDDGTIPVASLAEGQPGVRYHRLAEKERIGTKRNLGNSLARGEIVCLWDDDDWYAPERIRAQVLPILYDEADLTGIESTFMYCLVAGESWSATPAVHRSMFEGDVAGGTLAFRRAVSDRVRFPGTSLAEDASLLRAALAQGFRLKRLSNEGRFIYMRHGGNTWGFVAGRHLDPAGWSRTILPAGFTPAMLAAYQAASGHRQWDRASAARGPAECSSDG